MPTPRALVVDDELDIRQLAVRALRDEGIEADMAADGAQAIHRCGMTDYDVVLTDLRMPNMHGHALATALLARERRPLVIVLTAVPEPALVTDMLSRGVDDYVTKPVNFKLLAAKIRALLNRHDEDSFERSAIAAAAFDMTYCKGKSENEVILETIEQQLVDAACNVPREVVACLTQEAGIQEPPDGLREFAESLHLRAKTGDRVVPERKAARVIMPVAAVAVDANTLRPYGLPFKMLTYELSRGRIRFVHPAPLRQYTVAVRWPMCTREGEAYLVVQITRCQRRRALFDLRGHLLVL